MSTMTIIIPVAGVLALIAFALAWGLNSISQPSGGAPIPEYLKPGRALLIIDVQEDLTGSFARHTSPYVKDSAQFIARLNRLIGHACKNRMEIVYLRLEFSGLGGKIMSAAFHSGTGMKGSPGAALDERLLVMSGNVYARSRWDALGEPAVEALLEGCQVNELFLAGIDALYTVHATARGALQRGYKVNVITDGVLLGSPSKQSALLDKYRSDGIELISSQDFLQSGF